MSKTHWDAWKAKGLPMALLVSKTGMSPPALYECLKQSRFPTNPIIAKAYAELLDLELVPTGAAQAVAP